jgi:hypothetical protein
MHIFSIRKHGFARPAAQALRGSCSAPSPHVQHNLASLKSNCSYGQEEYVCGVTGMEDPTRMPSSN